jgi:hypothetical protein
MRRGLVSSSIRFFLSIFAVGMFFPVVSYAFHHSFQENIIWTPIPGPDKKCPINDEYYFKYEFSKKPKMGMVILKIQVFDKKKNQVVPFKAVGRTDMPSMSGAHDSGEVEFKLNRKNDYLLPVNVVMPGEWEIQVVFWLNDQPVFHGSIRFEV